MSSTRIWGRIEGVVSNSLLLSGIALLLSSPALATQNVTLAWNASTDPTVVGYNIYYGGASATYTNTLSAGNATNLTVSGLVGGNTYYFAATTYNSAGVQSPFSNEVFYSVPTNAATGNQPPTLNPISNLTINENAGPQVVNLSGITSGAANENQALTVTATSGNTNLIPDPAVNYLSPNTNGSLTFTPVAYANGSTTISVTVNDGGASNNIITRTFTVTVNPVNQPPTLNPVSNLTINENAVLQTVNLSGITSGAANENQTLTVTATSGNTNLIPNPAVQYTSANTSGSLTFTPVINGNGSTTVSVTVNDGGASNNIVTRTFTVTVNPVNQPPTLNPISNLTLNENAGLQTVNLSGITSGAANENQTLTVIASSGNTNLIPNPTVNYLSSNTNGSLSFTPVANASGSTTISVRVNDGGASSNTITRTFTVTVNPVNQPPALDPVSNLTINENAGLQTVNLSGITSGAANENQTLTVTAASGNTNLIPKPTVHYTSANTNGSLTFTPVANANGSTTVSVTVNDGGASNNIVSRTFTVTVNPVNQPPTLNPISNLTINQNTGPQTVNLAGISSGAANENQTLSVTATSGNTNLIPNPAVNYLSPNTNGWVTFTPATNASGSALISVTVNDNGASNNLVTQSFTVTVRAFNDTNRPTVQITVPTSNQQLTNSVTTMTGKAGDNIAVAAVYYSLNGSAWAAASTANNWTNWSANNLPLTPGTNTVQAYAADTSGNRSAISTNRFIYLAYQRVKVKIHGKGSVNPNYDNMLLAVNLNYSMTASAQSGFTFTNWTGDVSTNSATVKFQMATNLTLTANFADVSKPTVSIVTPTSNQQWTNGTFSVTGKAGDNVAVSAVYYSLNGSAWTVAATANNWTNWTANLTLTPGTNTVQAYASDTSGNLSTTNKVTFAYKTAPNSFAGLLGAVNEDGGGTFYLCFGTSTFSQNSSSANYDNGVGNYTYQQLTPSTAQLTFTYTAPPNVSGVKTVALLTFITNNQCLFMNRSNVANTGTIRFSAAPNWAPTSVNGKASALIAEGQLTTLGFASSTLTITNADGQVTNGNYSFKQYSPLGALLTVTQPGETKVAR